MSLLLELAVLIAVLGLFNLLSAKALEIGVDAVCKFLDKLKYLTNGDDGKNLSILDIYRKYCGPGSDEVH